MPTLNLKKGDIVQLSSSIEKNGKIYSLISYDSHKGRQFKGIYCIRDDLLKIQNSIKNYIRKPSHYFEHFHALTILYQKCWNDSGSRNFKLEIKRDLKNAPKVLLDFHDFLFNLGNKYIAHPENTEYDQSILLLIIDNQKAIGVRPQRMTLENLSLDEYRTWL